MDNSKYLRIKNGVLKECNTTVKGHLVIPDGVTSIGNNAFVGCSSLTRIDIPNSVTRIGEGAFRDCRNLKTINIPNSVTEICRSAFLYCGSIKSIEIPNSVQYIGDFAFEECAILKSINIPKSVTNISYRPFFSCPSLKCNQIDKSQKEILAYKGFESDFTCRGFKYKVGKTYHEDKAKVCWCGFHACLNPLDVLAFYPNENGNRFALVELSGDIDWKNFCCYNSVSKIAATNIKIIKELTFDDLISEFNRLNK